MDLELDGKAAIVTGGSRGIGKAIARELAKEGVDVAIVARGKAAITYGVRGVPEKFLIDREGRLVRKYMGPISGAQLESILNELLGQGGSG